VSVDKGISIIFTAKDNFSTGIKNMMSQQDKFKKDLNMLNSDLNKFNNKKIDLKLDAKKAQDDLKNTAKDAKTLGVSFDELFKERAGKQMAIQKDLAEASKQIKQTEKDIRNLTGEVSKFDNGISARNNTNSSGTMLKAGLGAMVGNQLGGFLTNITGTFLPNSLNSGIQGALTGAGAGMAFGPAGAAVGAAIGGITSLVGSEIQKQTDKQRQRIQFGSGLFQQYLPQLAMGSIGYASNMEQTNIGFETMLGKDGSDNFLNSLLDFSAKTPFEFADLTGSSKQMLAYGFAPGEIIPTLTAIGDAASGLGLGKDGIEAITTSIGRMKVSGKVNLEYLNPLIERGVDAWGILSKSTGKTTAELQDMVSKGTLPAKESILALVNGMEEKFPNMMSKQAASFQGLISTIKDGFSQIIQGPLGQGFIDGIKPAMQRFAEFFGLGTKGFGDLKNDIYTFGNEAGTFLGNTIDGFRTSLNEFFNNEDFQNASLPDKFTMVLDKLKEKANEWYSTGGKELMNSMSTFFTDTFVALSKDDKFLNAAQDLWLSIAPTDETMKKIINKATGWGKFKESIKNTYETIGEAHNYNTLSIPGYAVGLGRVPYDNYPAILHEGERVLTRSEADNYKAGGSGINIAKLADTIVIREDADIDRIANALINNINMARTAFGGEH
jgi:tape measure domain-containing protein